MQRKADMQTSTCIYQQTNATTAGSMTPEILLHKDHKSYICPAVAA